MFTWKHFGGDSGDLMLLKRQQKSCCHLIAVVNLPADASHRLPAQAGRRCAVLTGVMEADSQVPAEQQLEVVEGTLCPEEAHSQFL